MKRTPEQWLAKLQSEHASKLTQLQEWNRYYEGEQELAYLAPELLAEMGDRLQAVIINWPRLVVDSVEERMDVRGFRLPGQDRGDADMWKLWQYNNLDELSQQAHVDTLVMGRSYVIVGANEDDDSSPRITVESPLEAYACHDPRTRKVAAAYKKWSDTDPDGKTIEYATLYLPDSTRYYRKTDGKWVLDPEYPVDEHNLGVVPVVPLVNRARTGQMDGVSELKDVIPLSDAGCKAATDMMVTSEFHAAPRRWALGFDPEDFQDENGNKVSAFSRIIGRIWASRKTTKEGAQVGQFPEAQLSNFHETLKLLAQFVASLGALPPQFLGFTTDNPASADAMRSSETRLIKRAERKRVPWSGTWEEVMRIADRIKNGEWREDLKQMETLWVPAATPTVAQQADAAVKLHADKIVPLRQTREDLGYTDIQIERMEEEDDKALERETSAVFGPQKTDNAPPPGVPEPDPLPVAA